MTQHYEPAWIRNSSGLQLLLAVPSARWSAMLRSCAVCHRSTNRVSAVAALLFLAAAVSSQPVDGQGRMRPPPPPQPERSAARTMPRGPSPMAAVPAAATPGHAPQPAAAFLQPQEVTSSLDNMPQAPVEASIAAAVTQDDAGSFASLPPTLAGDEELVPLTSISGSAFGAPLMYASNHDADAWDHSCQVETVPPVSTTRCRKGVC